MNELITELENYYANLLIIQYWGKPKAVETIKLLVRICWINAVLMQMKGAFDVDTAEGTQLDILGIWVGVDRNLDKALFDGHNWFSLIEITGAISPYQGGFSEVSNFGDEDGGFLTSADAGVDLIKLTDANFKFLLKLKIIKNNIDHTCKSIDDAIYKLTNGEIYTTWDLANGFLTYHCPSSQLELMDVANHKNVLPCPMSCSIKIEEY